MKIINQNQMNREPNVKECKKKLLKKRKKTQKLQLKLMQKYNWK